MDLASVRDWLKSLNVLDATWTIGRIEAQKEKRVGVYQRPDYGTANVAIGGEATTKTKIKNLSILVHWNRNHKETEAAAQALYDALAFNPPSGTGITYIGLSMTEPADVGSDDNGIFERVIWLTLYYEEGEQA